MLGFVDDVMLGLGMAADGAVTVIGDAAAGAFAVAMGFCLRT